jgi:hypothetical protein
MHIEFVSTADEALKINQIAWRMAQLCSISMHGGSLYIAHVVS